MSYKEKCVAALELVPESKLGYLFAYIQGLIADVADNQEDIPNAETIASMNEIREMIKTGSGEHFTGSTADLFATILAGDD